MKLLIICGPTATGKTDLAIKLAHKFDAEIISADSRQVYHGMDIGTGKDLPTKETIEKLRVSVQYRAHEYSVAPYKVFGVPIWLYDVVGPDEPFSVSLFKHLAQAIIAHADKSNKLAILVGGAGLYIDSLFTERETFTVPPDSKLRQKLSVLAISDLQKLVAQEAPQVWQELNVSDRRNPRRLVRKIEIADFQKAHPSVQIKFSGRSVNLLKTSDNILRIGLTSTYPELYQRIDARVDKRISQGLVSEIERLLSAGYTWEMPGLDALGYKQWKDYFQMGKDETRKQQIIKRWKYDEHGYARRQMTWFRKTSKIIWFDVADDDHVAKIEELVYKWYTIK